MMARAVSGVSGAVVESFGCTDAERFLGYYVDGELLGEDRVELERHLAGCADCARKAHAQAAYKAELKAALPRPELPVGLQERLRLALDRTPVAVPGWRTTAWKYAPAAVAAVLLITLVGTTRRFSPVAAEAITSHRLDLPVDVTGSPDAVRAWFNQRVNFAVRPPHLPSATLVGARLSQIRDRRAAYLVYNVRGNRVSVFLFDPSDLAMESPRHFEAGGHEVYLDEQRGYHVALVRDRGLGYAFTSDLDEDQMIQLVSSAIQQR